MKIMGIDPSMRNFGIVAGVWDGRICIEQCKLITTESTKTKTVRKNSDDLERARQIYTELHETIASWQPSIVAVEVPVGSQSARAMTSYGICIGLLASISQALIQVTPSEVKLAAVGTKTASKAEMIDWAVTQWPSANWIQTKAGKYTNANEHLADAAAALVAASRTDFFKAISAMKAAA